MKLTRITSDDWQGLYLDGKLIGQNHSVDLFDELRRYLRDNGPIVLDSIRSKTVDGDWIESVGQLPCNLSDIPKV